MSRQVTGFFAVVAFSLGGLITHAQQPDYAKPVLEKAIKALGDADKQKQSGTTFDNQSKLTIGDSNIDLGGSWSVQGYDKLNVSLNLKLNGNPIGLLVVINGKKAWTNNQQNGQTDNVEARHVDIVQSILRAVRLAQRPGFLLEKGFKLTPLGEMPINDTTGVGLKVEQKDYRDMNLYFDKKTGLPLRSEVNVKEDGNVQEVPYMFTFSDYKEIDGVKHFTKIIVHRDQQQIIEMELTNIRLQENLNANLFTKP